MPSARMSSITSRKPSRCCEDNSISAYQAMRRGERIAAAGAVFEHQLDAAPRHDLEAGDAAGGALGGDAEEFKRRFAAT